MRLLDTVALAALAKVSPAGVLLDLAAQNANQDLEALQDEFDSMEARVQKHLAEPSLVARLEDDFARCVPSISDAAVPLESWAIPLLSALAGPAAPLLSFGLQVACKVALYALENWADKRLKGKSA